MSSKSPDSDRLVHGLFLTHIGVIRGFIRALVRDEHLADDVLQETFLTVTRKAGDFEEGTNFPKWACSIARYKVLEAVRRESKQGLHFSEDVIESLAADRPEILDDDRFAHLEACLGKLPRGLRKMVDLCYVSQRKPAEIARQLDWKVEAVYVSLSRARSVIRDCMKLRMEMEGGK